MSIGSRLKVIDNPALLHCFTLEFSNTHASLPNVQGKDLLKGCSRWSENPISPPNWLYILFRASGIGSPIMLGLLQIAYSGLAGYLGAK